MTKIFCRRCEQFTQHSVYKHPRCDRCRALGDTVRVLMLIVVPIIMFLIAIYQIWGRGR